MLYTEKEKHEIERVKEVFAGWYAPKFLSRRTRKCFTQKKRNMKLSE